jgi:hypothetical protein
MVMVGTVQMQHAMNQKMSEVVVEGLPLGCGLAPHHAKGEHDLAARTGGHGLEGQHIRRFVAATVTGIEPANRAVIGQNDGIDHRVWRGSLGGLDGAGDPCFQPWHEAAPVPILDDDCRNGGRGR